MQTQKQLISSINKQTHRLDSSDKSKLSQTRLVLRCDNCGGLPKNHNEVLSINYSGFCSDCVEDIAIDHVQLEVQEFCASEYGTELHND